jgi:hypothetical protein
MDELIITLDAGVIRGLQAVVALDSAATTPDALARELVRAGLQARLDAVCLPWAPTPEQVAARCSTAGPVSAPALGLPFARLHAVWQNTRIRALVSGMLAVAVLVVLVGGYAGGWSWTGLRDNNQLWDWLQLLVLPVALATLPIWLIHADRMSRVRRICFAAFVAAFAVFVLIGYTAPLGWTGFSGNKLWDWITLLLLPITLITVSTWVKTARPLRRPHWTAIALLGAGWVLTIIGGYFWSWNWTGYEGNTLWDWTQLLLLPIIFPTILAPALLSLVTGDVEVRLRRASEESSRRPVAPATRAG